MEKLLNFDHTYYEDEVRDGFYVPTMMKRYWASQLEVLAEIDRICTKHHIEYFAEWGTLLGAIRHKGAIPWDDDLDIAMKRDEYNRFYKICKTELSEEFQVFSTIDMDGNNNMIARIITTAISYDAEWIEKFHDIPFIVGVDIFVLDYISTDPKEDELQGFMYFQAIGLANMFDKEATEFGDHIKEVRQVEQMCNLKLHEGFSIQRQLFNFAERIASMFTYDDAEYITIMYNWNDVSGKGNSKRYRFPKEYYDKSIRVPFEGMTIPVPYHYDDILRVKYGDYMQLVKDGGGHDYPIYTKQEDVIKEKVGFDPYKTYSYSPEDAEPIVPRDEGILAVVRENIVLWNEVLAELRRLYDAGDGEGFYDILSQWQEMVISLGDQVEKNTIHHENFISYLEQLCEKIYEVSIAEGEEIVTKMMALEPFLMAVDASELKAVETEVYIVYKASQWPAICPMWEASMADEAKRVYVIVIPYFEKSGNGSLKTGMYYEGLDFPKEVTVVDFTTVDLEKMHPDRIITQYGYDDYSVGITTMTPFYVSELKKCTDELIYVPPLTPDAFTRANERSWFHTRYYVTIPGMALATHTIVDNEPLRQTYIEVLTDWAGEDTRQMWEEKLVVSNVAKEELTKDDYWAQTPDQWQQVRKETTIAFLMSVSIFIHDPEEAMEKLRRTIHVFKENKERVSVLWIQDENFDVVFADEELADYRAPYEEVVAEFERDGLGVYVRGDEPIDVPIEKLVDGYYGDASRLGHACAEAGCAVLIENVEI